MESTYGPTSTVDEWNWHVGHRQMMENLLKTGYQSDLTIVIGGKEFKVHKLILGAGSRVLHTRIRKCTNDRLVLEHDDMDSDVFYMLLMYLYTGVSGANMRHALRLLRMATEFKVAELSDQCTELLKGEITMDNVIQIFNEAMLFAHKDLIRHTLDFICCHAQTVLYSKDFPQLRLEGLVEILQQDSLHVKGEIDVFNAMYRWGEVQLSNQQQEFNTPNMKTVLAKPLKYIRFPLMDSQDFGRTVGPKNLLEAQDTISLLTSYLLPQSERGKIVGGSFSADSRTYLVDKEIVIYRAGSGSVEISRHSNSSNSEKFQFCSTRDGTINELGFSEACFDIQGNGTVSYHPQMTFSVEFADCTFIDLSHERCSSERLSPGKFGCIIVNLPRPVPFSKDVWIDINVTVKLPIGFNNIQNSLSLQSPFTCGGHQQPNCLQNAYPYKGDYIDQSDTSIKFKFRKGPNDAATEFGLINHFRVVLSAT